MRKMAAVLKRAIEEGDKAYAATPEDAAVAYFEAVTEARDLLTALEVIAYGNAGDQNEWLAAHGWEQGVDDAASRMQHVAAKASEGQLQNQTMADAHSTLRKIRHRTPEFLRRWLEDYGKDTDGSYEGLVRRVAATALSWYVAQPASRVHDDLLAYEMDRPAPVRDRLFKS